MFLSAGACALAGIAAGAIAARHSTGRFGGRKFWKAFAINSAWAVAGAGVGKGIGYLYKRFGRGYRYMTNYKMGRWKRFYWKWVRGHSHRGRAARPERGRGHRGMYFVHQAKAGAIGSIYSNGWYRRRNRNYD